MSLKAKIEAVIYASEEPVTLAQLMGLLGGEAQVELDELESQQSSLALSEAGGDQPEAKPSDQEEDDQDALNAETLGEGEGEAEAAEDAEAATSEPESFGAEAAASDGGEEYPEADRPAPSLQEGATETAQPGSAADIDPKIQAREAASAAKLRERKLRDYFRSLLDRLIAEYANSDRGLEIREIAGGFRLATKPEYHDAVRGFVKSLKPPLKLSLQALETLAVVAYKQPVTSPEVSEIRGVDSGGVLGSLLARKLVNTAGRKQVIGRPILYKTTKEFLVRFGLKDINELPSIEEFEKMAGEFAESEPVQEEMQMEAPPNDTSEESPASGDSPAVDEINSAPEPTTTLHESVDDMVNDKSYSPEGGNTEPARHSEEAVASRDVEPNADVHQPQADGDDRDVDVADDVIVDGRISGIDPPDNEDDNPSAEEAAEQESGAS